MGWGGSYFITESDADYYKKKISDAKKIIESKEKWDIKIKESLFSFFIEEFSELVDELHACAYASRCKMFEVKKKEKR